MKLKLLAQLAIALPVAAISAVSFSSAASAAFIGGDTLRLAGGLSYQFFNPTDTDGNLVNDTADISLLFNPARPVPTTPDPALPGSLARTTVQTQNNTGAFAQYNAPPASVQSYGSVKSFNLYCNGTGSLFCAGTNGGGGDDVTGLTDSTDSFIQIVNTLLGNTPTNQFLFSIEIPSIVIDFNTTTNQLSFLASGSAKDLSDGEVAAATYNFSAELFQGGIIFPDFNQPFPQTSGLGNYSGSIKVQTSVPEPNSTVGLLALGILTATTAAAKHKRKGDS